MARPPLDFVSYSGNSLPFKKIKKYARQYDGVDMAKLAKFADDCRPVVVWVSERDFDVLLWCTNRGLFDMIWQDKVFLYALAVWFRDNGFPCVRSSAEAEQLVARENWDK